MVDLNKNRQDELIKKIKELYYSQYDYYLENDEAILLVDYIKQLEQQLQQRNEVIEETINHLDCFISDVNLSKYDTLAILMYIKKILKKYKGDNNETLGK